MDAQIHVFLTSAIDRSEYFPSYSGRFTAEIKARRIHLIGGWLGFGKGRNDVGKIQLLMLPGLELRPSYRLTNIQHRHKLERYGKTCHKDGESGLDTLDSVQKY
jgi:hypothetical protein